MKRLLKKGLTSSPALKILSTASKGKAVILMYHGFSPPCECVRPDTLGKHQPINFFEQQLQFIVEYCNPVSLERVLSGLPLPPRSVVLTFDDGYRNNYKLAFPLLQRYNAPATIFVTTGFVDQTHPLWNDRLEYLIANSVGACVEIKCDGVALQLATGTEQEKQASLAKANHLFKVMPETQKQRLLNALEEALKVSWEWNNIPDMICPLGWGEIREMQRSGLVAIGSHTVSHPILSRCDEAQLKDELKLSRQRIEEETEAPCHLFAYPNGEAGDYSEQSIEWLEKSGYTGAVTTIGGMVDTSSYDRYQLPRYGTDEPWVENFKMLVTGMSELAMKTRRLFGIGQNRLSPSYLAAKRAYSIS